MATIDLGDQTANHLKGTKENENSLANLVRQREDVDVEIETLCNVMYQLNVSRVQYEKSIETISKLNSMMDEMPVMIPLTNNMYAQANLGRTNEITINLGDEYHIEVDKVTAINHLLTRIQRIISKIGISQKVLASKVLERERLRKIATEKFMEEQKEAENTNIHTDLTDLHV